MGLGRGPRPRYASSVMRIEAALGLLLALALTACGSKDNVSLSASVGNPNLTVADKALGTELGGGFTLFLEVGAQAEQAATVDLEAFSVVRVSDSASVVPTLQAVPTGVTFPLKVNAGESRNIPFTIDTSKLLPASAQADLCASPVKIVGAVKHDLNGGETKPVESPPVTPSGC